MPTARDYYSYETGPYEGMMMIGYNGELEESPGTVSEPFRTSIPVSLNAPEASSGALSSRGAQDILDSMRSGLTSSNVSQPQAPSGDVIYPAGGVGPNYAANYPIENPHDWAGTWGGSLKKSSSGITSAGTSKPYGTISETQTVFPKGVSAPEFKGPAYDEREVRKRAQKLMAPGKAALEMQVQQALSKTYENPNVRRLMLRATLQGYGIGLANLVGQSEQAASKQYEMEHARLYNEAIQGYNIAMQKYMSEARQVSTQRTVATKAEYDKAFKDF